MSKKLIAVASAAALALTALVGVAPANATAAAIAYTIGGSAPSTTGATAAAAYEVPVPQTNSLIAANTLLIAVTNLLPGDVVTVSATGAAKVSKALHAQSSLVSVATLGAATQTTTIGSGETGEDMHVFTTSTLTASTITITVTETDGTTKSTTNATKHIIATSSATDGSGNVYKVKNVVAPSTLAAGVEAEVTFIVTDAFDNQLETPTISGALATSAGTLTGSGIATYDTVRDLHVAKVTAASANPFVLTIDANGGTAAPSNLGLGASSTTAVAVVNGTGVAAQIVALTAQVTSLIADYNALAAKWNKRVASKTAPKKKVVLK